MFAERMYTFPAVLVPQLNGFVITWRNDQAAIRRKPARNADIKWGCRYIWLRQTSHTSHSGPSWYAGWGRRGIYLWPKLDFNQRCSISHFELKGPVIHPFFLSCYWLCVVLWPILLHELPLVVRKRIPAWVHCSHISLPSARETFKLRAGTREPRFKPRTSEPWSRRADLSVTSYLLWIATS